jgi:hypothetical protein
MIVNTQRESYFARFYLLLIMLTIGIKFPFGNYFSSLSIFIMIISFVHLLVEKIIFKIKFYKQFLTNNIYFSILILFYTLLAVLNGKYYYKPYPFIILFFQWTFFLIVERIGNSQIVNVFVKFLLLNMVFYLIQIFGSLIGNAEIVKLSFLGAEKAGVEYFGFLPRASGLINEPSHLSYIFLPLCVILLYQKGDFLLKRKYKYFIYSFYLTTFSIISYLQLTIIYLVKIFKHSKFKLAFVLILINFTFLIIAQNSIFSGRIAGINDVLLGEKTAESSVLSIQSNFLVMIESFKVNPLLGGGLTSHRASYDYFIGNIFPEFTEDGFLGLNQNDGSSLYILIASEMGLIGLILFLYFLFKIINKFRMNLGKNIVGFSFAVSLFFVGLRFGNIASFYIIFYIMVILKEFSINDGSIISVDSK